MRHYHHEVPGPFAVIVQILSGALVGVLIAGVYLALKPVKIVETAAAADAKTKEAVVERNVVTYRPGNPGNPNGQQWRIRERAFLEKAPTGVSWSEQDVNRWLATTYGSQDRRVKLDDYGVEFDPEPPLCRIDGNEMQIALVYHCRYEKADKAIVAQARGSFERDGDVNVFKPRVVYLGSCPLPGRLGTMLLEKLAAAYPAPENVAASWKAVTSAKVEESQLKVAFN